MLSPGFEDLVVGNGGAAGSRVGSLVALASIFFGAKTRGGRGVYMGLERLDRNRLNATNLLQIWLGFRRGFRAG